eukprot:SAG11_NODE_658_length_7897_cov_13.075789_3_plen_92_part_00
MDQVIAFENISDIDRLLPLIAGCLMIFLGVLFIFLHICPCYEGCCKDGNYLDAVVISDMSSTAMKQQKMGLDRTLRILSMFAGVSLWCGSH